MKKISNNLGKWLHLRLSEDEHRIIKEKQKRSTTRNLSQYLRDIIFERPVVATYRNLSQDAMLKELALLNQELNAIGNNLNQITKKFHTLQVYEEKSWVTGFSARAEELLSKISEVKELISKIAERWLR